MKMMNSWKYQRLNGVFLGSKAAEVNLEELWVGRRGHPASAEGGQAGLQVCGSLFSHNQCKSFLWCIQR